MLGSALLRFATSRVGLLILLGATLFAWHKIDKTSAVREAVVGYVADVELAAAQREAAVLRQRAERLRLANENLRASLARAEKEADDAEAERARYLEQNPLPPDACGVGLDLLDLLRAE